MPDYFELYAVPYNVLTKLVQNEGLIISLTVGIRYICYIYMYVWLNICYITDNINCVTMTMLSSLKEVTSQNLIIVL